MGSFICRAGPTATSNTRQHSRLGTHLHAIDASLISFDHNITDTGDVEAGGLDLFRLRFVVVRFGDFSVIAVADLCPSALPKVAVVAIEPPTLPRLFLYCWPCGSDAVV